MLGGPYIFSLGGTNHDPDHTMSALPFSGGVVMMMYAYAFKTGTKTYYVYAESKEAAIAEYLEDHNLRELPKNTTVERIPHH